MKIILFIFLQVLLCNCQDQESTTEVLEFTTEEPDNHGYIVQVSALIDNDKISNFLAKIIVNEHEKYRITTQDVLQITGINQMTFEEFKVSYEQNDWTFLSFEHLWKLGKPYTIVTEILNNLNLSLMDLSGKGILNILEIDIETLAFQLIIENKTYLETLNITNEKLERIKTELNLNDEQIFLATRDALVKLLIAKDVEFYLTNYKPLTSLESISQSITPQKIFESEKFRELVDNIYKEANQMEALGAITAPRRLIVNKIVFDQWQNHLDILKITVHSITMGDAATASHPTIIRRALNIFELPLDNEFSKSIAPKKVTEDLVNCTYLTRSEGDLVAQETPEITNEDSLLFLARNDSTTLSFLPGSALICSRRLIGLASKANETHIIFDSLFSEGDVFVPPVDGPVTSATSISHLYYLIPILATIFHFLLV